jgi:hypothetical protein
MAVRRDVPLGGIRAEQTFGCSALRGFSGKDVVLWYWDMIV